MLKTAKTEYNIIPELTQRWSPRAFGEKEVPTDALKRIFEAARWAPSSRNEQPWRFIIARKGEPHYDKLFEGLNEWNRKWAWTAPVLFSVLAVKKHEYKGRENSYCQHDVGLAMGNLLAQATHEGLALHQMAGIHKDKIAENFGVDEDEYEVMTITALGYQDEKRLDELDEKYREAEEKPRDRKPLKELLFAGRTGEAPDWL